MTCLVALVAFAAAVEPALPTSWHAPEDWQVETFANGDLNGDGLPDLVALLRNAQDEMKLGVYLQQTDGGWKLAADSSGAVCYRCGEGPKAPEVEGQPRIEKGVLKLSYVSGSRDATETVAKFRRDRAGHFILIGYTYQAWDSVSAHPDQVAGYELKDANLSTMKMSVTHGKKTVTCHLGKALKGVELSKFEYGKFDVGDCARGKK